MKLENLQPSSSFKSRGIGHLMALALRHHGVNAPIHYYCSSGGNAGIACATAAISLNRPATIVVPTSTSELMVSKLRTLGAHTVVHGAHWSEADEYMRRELMASDANAVYVPPFDHPHVWAGHESLIDELELQMRDTGGYDAVVCSVGGGGLFIGIMDALERHGRLQAGQYRQPVRVMAMETKGADSLAFALKKGSLARLGAITSIATSLGATQVAEKAYAWAKNPLVRSCVLSDAEAAMACVEFADDERILVEPACGVSIAPAYNGSLSSMFPTLTPDEFSKLNIVLIVCGGSKATLQILEEYRDTYGADEDVVKKIKQRKSGLR